MKDGRARGKRPGEGIFVMTRFITAVLGPVIIGPIIVWIIIDLV